MAEYIDRDKALDEYDAWIESTGALPKGTSYYYECRGCIEDVPAADVAPVRHGRWCDPESDDGGYEWHCSCCGFPAHFMFKPSMYQYCPRCGAKMDKEE